jgi:hypothetical protein
MAAAATNATAAPATLPLAAAPPAPPTAQHESVHTTALLVALLVPSAVVVAVFVTIAVLRVTWAKWDVCDAADAVPHVASHERGGAVGENLL